MDESAWKRGENTNSGHFRVKCIGTPCVCTGTLSVLIIFGQSVPVHIRGVPVPIVVCNLK